MTFAHFRHSALVAALVSISSLAAAAQAPRAETDPLQGHRRSIAELLATLPNVATPTIDEQRALWLAALPLSCIDRLQPRPGARANSGSGYFWVPTYSLAPDHDRLRAFWGCSDWHSAVASTWVAVELLGRHPQSTLHELTREKLNAHLAKSNLDGELEFFRATAEAINPIPSANQTGLFERPLGFAWLLELSRALRTLPDSQAKRWSANVAPLATWMADSLGAYYEKLVEPVRSGAATNTANTMILALDYARATRDGRLERSITTAARKLFFADTMCATERERVNAGVNGRGGGRGGRAGGRGRGSSDSTSTAPNDLTATGRGAAQAAAGGGADVISPCLSEAAIMGRVLETKAYVAWLDHFLPPLESDRFAPLRDTVPTPRAAPVTYSPRSERADTSAPARIATVVPAAAAIANEHARLAGLSFARATSMEQIAHALPTNDQRVAALHRLAAIHAARGYALMQDDTSGLSWLPAQALLFDIARR